MDNSSEMEKPIPAERLAENSELLIQFFEDYVNLVAPDFTEGKRDELEICLRGGIGDQKDSRLIFGAYRERAYTDENSPEDRVLYVVERVESEDTHLPEEVIEQMDYIIGEQDGRDDSDRGPENPKRITSHMLFINDRNNQPGFKITMSYQYRGYAVIDTSAETEISNFKSINVKKPDDFEALIIAAELEWKRKEIAKLLGYMAGARPPES